MIIISAVAKKNRVIGTERGLPWDIPGEYEHFLKCVNGYPVIMGRKTYDILGGVGQSYEKKPESKLFVVSKSVSSLPDAEVCGSFEEAVRKASGMSRDIFVAGGESIYKQALPLADKMYISFIYGDYEGNAHFPEFKEDSWRVASVEEHKDQGWDFVVYERGRRQTSE